MSKNNWFPIILILFLSFVIGCRMNKTDQNVKKLSNELSTTNNELITANFIAKYGENGSVNYIATLTYNGASVGHVSSINKKKATINVTTAEGYTSEEKISQLDVVKPTDKEIKAYKKKYIEIKKDELEDK
ncbi:hypothetical protein ITQ94_09130 [Pediococcus pentosaceus]|uniref:hypothetical protein n=1 Tax=Pediococcus pentosaceus TaxID=1255 RepID=UPI0018FE09CF|nr:hypothetical protein [Pediococcus pentosaceus]MBF7131599.1 hypothetical protein [Pediococcus pentosaceus]